MKRCSEFAVGVTVATNDGISAQLAGSALPAELDWSMIIDAKSPISMT